MDLTALNLKNAATHLSEGNVVRGVGYIALLLPLPALANSQPVSLGFVDTATPIRNDTSEDFKVRNPDGGARITLFSEVTETARGFDLETYTQDLQTIGLHTGGIAKTVVAGVYAGSAIYDNGAEGTTSVAAVVIENTGTAGRSRLTFYPKASIKGSGTTNDDKPKLQFELRGNPAGVIWAIPTEFEGQPADVRAWGISMVLAYEDVALAANVLLNSVKPA